MSNSDIFRAALQRTDDCPPSKALERFLDGGDAKLARHVDTCAYCKTELELLRSFQSADVPAEDAAAVNAITQRLSQQGFGRPLPVGAPRRAWWSLDSSWLRTVSLAAAAVLVLVAVGLQFRHNGAPALRHTNDIGEYRSQSLAIVSPVGDLQAAPESVHWEPAPSAVRYQVRLLEVDGNELWTAKTSSTSVVFPAAIRALMVPAKTLTLVVESLDEQNRKIAESPKVNFRILQNIYSR